MKSASATELIVQYMRSSIRSRLRKVLHWVCVLLAFWQPILCVHASSPNIVLVLIDDMSWNGTSVQMHPNMPNSKSDFYQTPRLEEYAAQGMRFYNGYAAQSMCAPTRASILTGRSPAQLQMTDLPISYPGHERWEGHQSRLPLTPPAADPLQPDVFTIPQILRQANPNYATAHFGKWHLDATTGLDPEDVGYDTSVRKAPFLPVADDPKTMFHLANSAGIFMEESVQSGKPFFLQLSHTAVHDPIQSRQVMRDKYAALPPGAIHSAIPYAAMTDDLDTSFGMVMDKLDQLGISDNTYVIFTSDNGAPTNESNSAPLYRGKSYLYEGGIRMPYIVKGPGIEPGSFSGVPVNTTDLFSTVARLGGYTQELPDNVEGADITPVLFNGGTLPAGMDHLSRNFHEGGEIYWHWPQNFAPGPNFRIKPSSAVRDGDFKLYVEYAENGGADVVRLYNLTNDISETTNLASSMPAKATALRTMLNNYLETVDASFAYDVKAPATMNWNATLPGNVSDGWRSTIDIKYKGAETWKFGSDSQTPQRQATTSFQPGLPSHAFHFDGNDKMSRYFFHVGDNGPRRSAQPGTPDFDRSASMEFWVRLDSLTQNQIIFESGDSNQGISVTLGDADLDGKSNDVRFRVQGLTGPNGGAGGVPKNLTVTSKIDAFANPVADYVHLAAVFSDNPNDRYAELYVNGALAGRTTGATGITESLFWDGYDMAGLGNTGGNGLGAGGGGGPLPFQGGLNGDIAVARFNNFAINGSAVLTNYNSVLNSTNFGVRDLHGDSAIPESRTSSVALHATENSALSVFHERNDTLGQQLAVDSIVLPGSIFSGSNLPAPGAIGAGTRISSYLMQLDPTTSTPEVAQAQGSINFTGDILAIIWEPSSLAATDPLLGSIGNYGITSDRGIDFASAGNITIAEDLRTLSFDLQVPGDEMLQFRVLTAVFNDSDFNGDGWVNEADLAIWQGSLGMDAGGDADGDSDTDGRDFLIWQREFTPTAPPNADLTGDSVVDGSDLAIWQSAYGLHQGGDMDHDGDSDGDDFLFWQTEFGSTSADLDGNGLVDETDLITWQQSFGDDAAGDVNGDGVTNGRDFLAWQRLYSAAEEVSAAAVPEPSSLMLAGLLAMALGLRRRVA